MYHHKIYDPDDYKQCLNYCVRSLRKMMKRKDNPLAFDTVVFRGFSGAIIAPAVASRLGVNWALIRKGLTGNHSIDMINRGRKIERYIVIDDFIATGKTIRAIRDQVVEYYPSATYLGCFCWDKERIGSDYYPQDCLPVLNTIQPA